MVLHIYIAKDEGIKPLAYQVKMGTAEGATTQERMLPKNLRFNPDAGRTAEFLAACKKYGHCKLYISDNPNKAHLLTPFGARRNLPYKRLAHYRNEHAQTFESIADEYMMILSDDLTEVGLGQILDDLLDLTSRVDASSWLDWGYNAGELAIYTYGRRYDPHIVAHVSRFTTSETWSSSHGDGMEGWTTHKHKVYLSYDGAQYAYVSGDEAEELFNKLQDMMDYRATYDGVWLR